MAQGKRPRDIEFPDDDAIVAAVREHGSNTAAAKALGYSGPYWDKHIGERGLRERCAQARREYNAERRPPADAAREQERPGCEEHGDEAKVTSDASTVPQDVPTLLRHWGLDPEEWEVRDVKVNTWNAMTSDKKTGDNRIVRMHQLTVYLRKKLELALISPAAHVPKLVKPRPVRRDRAKPRVVFIEGDHQAPFFDPDLDAAVTGFVQDLQPDEHVFLGDTIDLSTISKYADHPATMGATPQVCLDEGYGIIRRRREAAPRARARKLKGNHDWRIEGEQLARSERMYGLKPAHIEGHEQLAAYSLRNLLHLDALEVELVEHPLGWEHGEIEIIPGARGLVARHGWLTGARTAERSMKKRGRSLIVAHGHTREHFFWWDPSAEVERQAAMCGVMCMARSDRFPHYAAIDNQLQGAMTVTIFPTGEFVFDHARWVDGRLLWRDSRYSPKTRSVRAAV